MIGAVSHIGAAAVPDFVAARQVCYTPRPAMEFSIVIPVRNEAANIAPLVAEMRAALDGRFDYEIVYVDDGSGDGTADAVRGLVRDLPRLRLVRHRRSCGQSAAIRSGVIAARAPWIVTLDGDGQNDPADIPRLFEIARAAPPEPPLLVAGLRAKRRDTLVKRLSSRLANGVRARMLGDATQDTGCGLKVMRRELYLELPFFDHNHRFLPALVQRQGGRTVSVPVNHRPRERGRSNYGVWDRLWVGIADLFGVMWLQRRGSRPEIVPDEAASLERPLQRRASVGP
jgi:dolichol-phosphate mannosyltransferase